MCILGGGTERPYFCYINPRNYRVQNHCVNYWHHVLYVIEGPTISCDSYLKERFLSLIVCLHILFISLFSAFLFFFFFLLFLLSAFCYPHFPIRIRHPQISGPISGLRFTDTPLHPGFRVVSLNRWSHRSAASKYKRIDGTKYRQTGTEEK